MITLARLNYLVNQEHREVRYKFLESIFENPVVQTIKENGVFEFMGESGIIVLKREFLNDFSENISNYSLKSILLYKPYDIVVDSIESSKVVDPLAKHAIDHTFINYRMVTKGCGYVIEVFSNIIEY